MKQALKAGDKPLLGVLRLLVSELKYKLIDDPQLSGDDEVRFLMSEAKKRRESIEAYKVASPERARAEEYELRVIESYMPEGMSDEEITAVVREVLSSNPSLQGGPLIGQVLGRIKQKGGIVDGTRVKMVIEKMVS